MDIIDAARPLQELFLINGHQVRQLVRYARAAGLLPAGTGGHAGGPPEATPERMAALLLTIMSATFGQHRLAGERADHFWKIRANDSGLDTPGGWQPRFGRSIEYLLSDPKIARQVREIGILASGNAWILMRDNHRSSKMLSFGSGHQSDMCYSVSIQQHDRNGVLVNIAKLLARV